MNTSASWSLELKNLVVISPKSTFSKNDSLLLLFVEDCIRCNVESDLIIANKLSGLSVSKLELLEKLP